MPPISAEPRSRALLPTKSFIALVAAIAALLLVALVSYRSLTDRGVTADAMRRATDIRKHLNDVLLALDDAETSQRGFLLTGEERYLEPYSRSVIDTPLAIQSLRATVVGDRELTGATDHVEALAKAKLDELRETIDVRRAGKSDAALSVVSSDRGKRLMDDLRAQIDTMLDTVNAQILERTADWEATAKWSTYTTLGGAGVLFAMLMLLGFFASRDFRAVEADGWVRRVQLSLGKQMQGDQKLESLGESVLNVLAANLDARVGAVYTNEGDVLRRVAGLALKGAGDERIKRGEGLVGQAAKDQRLVEIHDVPEDYVKVASATGETRPRELVLLPAVVDGSVQGVVELGFLERIDDVQRTALARAADAVAVAIRSARDRSRLEELLHETQQQAEVLQAQQEELRVTNEELEQQSRTLQLSQAQLENQQSELEQINTQLEEQTLSLERQRDELARTGSELQRANEYKSQFLANMSHELRTPLNSTLILAKLLSDNREKNLNEEQVSFAHTIYTAGNDLLTLINDILDLSKIEAGMLDVRSEPVTLARLADDLRNTFQPVANEKKLDLAVTIEASAPPTIDTDPTRVGQILKNLLSNALKFSDQGGVTLTVSAEGEQVAFAVKDTGIGIPKDQHELIFEAFRQADGGSTRKHGGTGLGLSISRDLARLLGGDLVLASTPGRGSTFTLTLPRKLAVAPRVATGAAAPASPDVVARTKKPPPAERAPRVAPIPDDRARTKAGARSLMIVEDDLAFARVLADLARELGYLVIAADTGDDALALARLHQPSAIVLDVGLPDRSGLSVLDALKHDSRTRHIPVHVVSVTDYTRTALEMGAVGYAIKPVQREQLVEAITHLESKFVTRMRRVLIVEDDKLLRDSTARLLASDNVETVVAGTTAEALAQLQKQTFDCMVLDLSLPDRSGLDLLEEMAHDDQHAFPPVIVYTGRKLTPDQVHQLEKFSRSIIIKGARSPERLLDEVTLFLHQVEADMPPERQHMLRDVRDREAVFEGRRILVVEDDVRNVFALSSVLQPKGAVVEVARNGKEALAALDRHPDIDLVLMDIMMPEMDGLEATRQLRAQPRFAKLPVIALTAKAMADDREKCLEAGANDYIAKPLDVDKLLSLARVWIRK